MTFEQGISHLTSTFNNMLYLAEEMFGERDKTWTYVGIEFYDDGPYVMYYPHKRISIVLSTNCSNLMSNHPQLYFQLAHEVCHLLYPTGKQDANVLNEGISTYFSKVYQEKLFPNSNYAIRNIEGSRYYRAYVLVEKLLGFDAAGIKKIRSVKSTLSYVTKEEIKLLNFGLTDSEIEELVERFS